MLVLDVRIIGDGLLALSVTSSSCVMPCAPQESVCIDVALRGAEKLCVVTLGALLQWQMLQQSLLSLKSSLVVCRLRLQTSWKLPLWVAGSFGALVRLAGVLAFNTALNSCRAIYTGH
jgi:hypothetical protein